MGQAGCSCERDASYSAQSSQIFTTDLGPSDQGASTDYQRNKLPIAGCEKTSDTQQGSRNAIRCFCAEKLVLAKEQGVNARQGSLLAPTPPSIYVYTKSLSQTLQDTNNNEFQKIFSKLRSGSGAALPVKCPLRGPQSRRPCRPTWPAPYRHFSFNAGSSASNAKLNALRQDAARRQSPPQKGTSPASTKQAVSKPR